MTSRRLRVGALAHAGAEFVGGDGPGYSRLVPASLLPPEDPAAAGGGRTMRDWIVDVLIFAGAVGLALLFWAVQNYPPHVAAGSPWRLPDALLGALGCLSLWGRRRAPVVVGLFTAVLALVSAAAAAASIAGLFTVAVHRRTGIALAVTAVNIVSGEVFALLRPADFGFVESSITNIGFGVVILAWGMFVRSRRQLVWTLRGRAERAEAEQQRHAEQARQAERTRIAREMHDVLAHRISMIALHAGGLQVRPDLPAEEVRDTAGLLRSTATQALEELRGVIGVLRTEADADASPTPPQPTLGDIPRLVDDTRQAGANIEFAMDVEEAAGIPASVGRDAYRVVQEALTNVAKHARGTATRVRVSGRPGDGLHVDVRNRLPVAAAGGPALPGSGTGLLGLRERVTLAGGTLVHGPSDDGEFVVDATLAWRP